MTATAANLLAQIIYGIGGLLTGLTVGGSIGYVRGFRHALVLLNGEDTELTALAAANGPAAVPLSIPTRSRGDAATGIVVVVLAVVAVAVSGVSTSRQSAVVACQVAFNQRVLDVLAQRSDAANTERVAQKTLLVTTSMTTDPDVKRRAVQTYLAALSVPDAKRDANPLPPRPAC